MEIDHIQHIEDCFDGSFIKEFVLRVPSDREFIYKLSHNCSLDYYPEFPRPFFRIENRGHWMIKGVEGANTFRVIFSRNATGTEVNTLEQLIQTL